MHVGAFSRRADDAVIFRPCRGLKLAGSRQAPQRVHGSFSHCIALPSSLRIKKARLPQVKSRGRVTKHHFRWKFERVHPTSWTSTRCHRRRRRRRLRPTPRARRSSNLNDIAHFHPSRAHRLPCSPVTTLERRSISRTTSRHAYSRTSAKVLGTRPITAIRHKSHQNPRRRRCRATTTRVFT